MRGCNPLFAARGARFGRFRKDDDASCFGTQLAPHSGGLVLYAAKAGRFGSRLARGHFANGTCDRYSSDYGGLVKIARLASPGIAVLTVLLLMSGCHRKNAGNGGSGSGGSGGGPDATVCMSASDCLDAKTDCRVTECVSGKCTHALSPMGAPCGVDAGVCTAAGDCVGCITADDCPAIECKTATCNQGTCGYANKSDGAVCMVQGTMPQACQATSCLQGTCVLSSKPDGTSCGTSGITPACQSPNACTAGACAPTMTCAQLGSAHGANHSQGAAFSLGMVTDCQEGDICDSLAPGETDWFTYDGIDSACQIYPAATFSQPLTVCEYWACKDSSLQIDQCPTGTTMSTAPNGAFGCCGTSTFGVHPCGGGLFDNGSATMWISVTDPTTATCTPYDVHYEF